MADARERREVLFEFTAVGAVMKVAAVDAATEIEVMVMGPTHALAGGPAKTRPCQAQ